MWVLLPVPSHADDQTRCPQLHPHHGLHAPHMTWRPPTTPTAYLLPQSIEHSPLPAVAPYVAWMPHHRWIPPLHEVWVNIGPHPTTQPPAAPTRPHPLHIPSWSHHPVFPIPPKVIDLTNSCLPLVVANTQALALHTCSWPPTIYWKVVHTLGSWSFISAWHW